MLLGRSSPLSGFLKSPTRFHQLTVVITSFKQFPGSSRAERRRWRDASILGYWTKRVLIKWLLFTPIFPLAFDFTSNAFTFIVIEKLLFYRVCNWEKKFYTYRVHTPTAGARFNNYETILPRSKRIATSAIGEEPYPVPVVYYSFPTGVSPLQFVVPASTTTAGYLRSN